MTDPVDVEAPRPYGAGAGLRKLTLAVALALTPLPAAAEVTLLAFGDSLTQGYGLPEADGFVPQLRDWLAAHGAADVNVINGGVSGDTTAGGLARIGWALSEDVDGVIVELGANDMLRGVDPGVTRANLDGILAAIEARGLPMILAGLPAPSNYGRDYRARFEAIFPELAAEHGAILYPSFLAGLGTAADLDAVRGRMQPDGIHPNAEGVRAIVAEIGPVVLDLVAAARD